MPPEESSSYPEDWIRIAKKDLLRVDRELSANDPDLAGFCLQQGIEKLLKAFLLTQGWKLRRIHNLDALIDDAKKFDESLGKYSEPCLKITGYYFAERYPGYMKTELTIEDVKKSVNDTQRLIDTLKSKLLTDPKAGKS